MIPDLRTLIASGVLAVLGIVGGGETWAAAAPTLVVATPAEPVLLDPAVAVDAASLAVTAQVHDTLVRLRAGTTEIEPALAARWEASADGLVWTFHLRPGVRFHDGAPVDAAAVAWNFERWRLSAHPQHVNQVRAGRTFEYWESLFGGFDEQSVVARVEVAGPLVLRLRLRQSFAPLLASLAVPGLAIASPPAVERAGPEYGKQPVGSGPYRFVAWRPRQEILLEAMPGHWGGAARVPRIVVRPIVNSAQRLAALQAGEVHLAEGLDPDHAPVVARDPGLALLVRPALTTGFIAFNFKVRELRDRRVRLAFRHALDRARLVEALYRGTGTVATQLQPPLSWGRDPELRDSGADPARARALLAEAGFPAGLDHVTWEDGRREPLTLWFMPVSRPYFPDPKEIAQALAADLARVGIAARLQTVDWAVYLERVRDGKLPLYMLGWIGDNGDPDNALCYVFCTPGASHQGFYANPALTALLLRARTLTDQAARARLYREAERLLHEDAARLFVAHSQTLLGTSRRVTGFVPSPVGGESWATVLLR